MSDKKHKFSAVSTEKYTSPTKGAGKQTIYLYGEENNYPEFLIKLFKSSATHSAIVTRKRDYTCGSGIDLNELDPAVKQILISSDIDSLLQNLSLDLEIFGGFAFRVQRNIINDSIIKFEYVDFSKLRQYEDGSLRYADVWKKFRTSAVEVRKWEKGGEGPQVYYYTGGIVREAYPDPGYVGAIPSIETDVEIQNFHLNNVKNGFSVPTMINFNNGLPSAEEAEEVEQTIIDKFTGSSNAGKFLINYAATKEEAATIEKLANDGYDEKFEVVAKQVQDKILIGHKVINPLLFGVMVPGQLGGRSELLESYELFKATYIETQRQALLGALEAVLSEYFGVVTLEIIDKKPVSEEEALYTNEELREKAGLPFIMETDFSKKLATMTPEIQKAVLAFLSKDELFSKLGI
jgi:hypothetical protein